MMKAILEKMGFRKEDEMYAAIRYKAMRISWIYMIIMLIGCYIYEFWQDGKVGFFPGFVMPTAISLLCITQLWYTHRMTADEKGKSEVVNWKIFLLAILFFVILFGIVLSIVTPNLFTGE